MQEGPGKGGQNSDESLEDEEAPRCPICLNRPRRMDRAVPDCCRHVYCSACILRWAQMVQSCPVDRRPFSVIYLQGSSQQRIKLPVKAPRLLESRDTCCRQDWPRMCRVSVGETGNTERTQEKRATTKQKCHRKCDLDASVDKKRKHFHSSLPSQQGATVGTLTQIMTGSVEVSEEGPDGIQWRRIERKRRWLPASVPVLSTGVPRVSLRSHLFLSAVSASLNLLLSENTVPHGIVCAVTCPKGEEKKGTRGSGSKTSVKPAENAAATRRSSRHSRSEAEDSSAAQSQQTDSDTTSSTPQTINDTHASTSRGQQGSNPRSGAKTRGRPKKVKMERHEDEKQETEVRNHDEDGVTEKTESEESKPDQKASFDQIDSDQELDDAEEKMEVENQTSPAEDECASPDASSPEEETAKVEEFVTESMVGDEDNQIPQEDSKQEVETNDEDQVELVNVPPIQEQDCPSPSCAELEESQSDSQDAESSLQAEPTAEPPTDDSDQIVDLKPEPDTTEDCSDEQESSSPPPLKEDHVSEPLVPEEKGVPESKDTNASSPQDNTDLIPMECDSPASEIEAHIAEAEMDPTANVPQMDDPTPKLDSCKEEKGSDKREREGRSRRSRFHSPTTTWSPNRESRSEGSRRSRSRSRDRSHKSRSTSQNREQQEEARDGRRNRSRSRSRSRERSRRRRSRSRNRSRPGRRSPSQERADHGGHSPRKRESWGGDGWRSRGDGRGFRNSNWRNNAEKPGHCSSREPVSSDNGNFHEASPDRGRSENPDWVQERERLWPDNDSRGREPRRDENAGDLPGESWSRGGWNAGRGRGGAHWSSGQQGEPSDNWRQRNSFSGTANNADSYNRFNDNRAVGKRKESEGAETPLDRSGWSSASSWAVRRTLPADVQNYYSRRDRGGGNNTWNRQEEDQGAPGVPKQADPPQNEPNAPLPTEAVPAMPPPLMPHQMGVMGVLRYPMGPLLPRPPAVGLQPPPQFSLPPPVPVQLHPTGQLIQVPSIAVQALPPPPPPPPPVQQGGFTAVPSESHPPQQVMPSFPVPGKGSFKPMPTKVVTGLLNAAQPSSTTTQPASHSKAHADSSKKEKKLQIQERAVNEVKAAIKPYYQKNEINKEEYKEIVRKAVEKVCHSKSGEVNADKVANLVKAYVDKYKRIRKSKSEKS
ncbi:protein SCAF11 isoform X5 [Onychostoma macrolepis]|uniref:protein SCAF11 isoform X5 n=1 Tax=Onychostoma macrolepis TaxID=369639 RepID=UPI00272D7DB9|nr:protein SCAF11 isoform X5 [Onychostoma macrolepis]